MQIAGWRSSWLIFAGYALVVLVLFTLVFKEKSGNQAAKRAA